MKGYINTGATGEKRRLNPLLEQLPYRIEGLQFAQRRRNDNGDFAGLIHMVTELIILRSVFVQTSQEILVLLFCDLHVAELPTIVPEDIEES